MKKSFTSVKQNNVCGLVCTVYDGVVTLNLHVKMLQIIPGKPVLLNKEGFYFN